MLSLLSQSDLQQIEMTLCYVQVLTELSALHQTYKVALSLSDLANHSQPLLIIAFLCHTGVLRLVPLPRDQRDEGGSRSLMEITEG